jgi:hypothetical protein
MKMEEQTQTGTIHLFKGKRINNVSIYVRSHLFIDGEYYLIQDNGQGLLTFKRCGMDIPKKAHKFIKTCNVGGQFSLVSELQLKKYYIDEYESNEDEIRVYYGEQS